MSEIGFEVFNQDGSKGNYRLRYPDGREVPVTDINTILLWEILKAVSK